VYLHGFVLFTAASAACGLAPALPVLVAVRVVQVGCAAMLQANNVAPGTTSAPAGRRCRPARRRWADGGPGGRRAAGRLGRLALDLLHQRPGRRGGSGGGLVLAAADPPSHRPPGHRSAGTDNAGRGGGRGRDAGRDLGSIRPGLPLPGVAGCAAVALLAGVALAWWERRATAPPVDVPMLAATGSWLLLAGALRACLVLSGPLVLIPQVLTGHGGSVVHAGLLSVLPAGSGWPP
jgi:hypothetical protein